MTIWSQSVARRALMGGERTHNPSPAAFFTLQKSFGKRRLLRGIRKVNRLRRSFHRGNPLPAVLGLAGGLAGKLGGRFKTPSERRAAGPAQALVDAAVKGNLTAAKAIAERTEIGIQKERAVWRKAFTQIPPNIVELVKKYNEQIPGVDHSTPEAARDSALARAVDGLALEAQAQAEQKAAGAARAGAASARAAAAAARQERREAQLAGVAQAGLTALAGRGRRPAQRRRKRRTSGRRVSL